MAFVCPRCSHGSLDISTQIALDGDSRSDEINVQIVECARPECGFLGVAVYEESRRGALDSESYDHDGYRIDEQQVRDLRALILQCPNRSDEYCRCPAHRRLSGTDTSGRWVGLGSSTGWDVQGYFLMDRR